MKASRTFALVLATLTSVLGVALYRQLYHSGVETAEPAKPLASTPERKPASRITAAAAMAPAPGSASASGEELMALAEQKKKADLASVATGLANSAGFQAYFAKEARAQVDGPYAALFKTLNLPEAQADKIKSLLAEKQIAQADIKSTIWGQGVDPAAASTKAKVAELRKEADGEIETKIHQELGDDNYAVYHDYAKTLPERNTVKTLTERLSTTATPLNDTQAQQLVQILASTAPARDNILARPDAKARVTPPAIEQAAKILTPPQVHALKHLGKPQTPPKVQ